MLEHDIAFLRGDQAEWNGQPRGLGEGHWRKPGSPTERLFCPGGTRSPAAGNPHVSPCGGSGPAHGAAGEAGLWEAGAAVREAFFGNASEAGQRATAHLSFPETASGVWRCLAFALAGDSTRAQVLANDLEKRFPDDTSVRFSYLPALRARLALNHGDIRRLFELLQAAVPLNWACSPAALVDSSEHSIRSMCVVRRIWPRTRRRSRRGISEILDHRGSLSAILWAPWRTCQLGRALAMSGDNTRAKTAYQDFSPSGKRPTRHPDP